MITKLTASGPQSLPFTWEYTLQTGYGALTAAPLVAGDRLICTTAGFVFALDLYTGQEIKGGGFPYKLKPSMKPPLTTHSRGTLYISNAGELVARQLSDGKEPLKWVDGKKESRWKIPRLGGLDSASGNDSVIVVTQANPDTVVIGINAADGSTRWGPVTVNENSPGPITPTRDVLLFVADKKLFGVNIQSGDTRFRFTPEGVADPLSLSAEPKMGTVGDKDIVVVAGTAVYGVNLLNGKQLWVHKASNPSPNTQWLTPAISEKYNRVVLANTDGEIFVLELSTGIQKWTTQVKGVDQLSIPGDKVYAAAVDGTPKLHVFELLTGKGLYSINMEERSRWGMITGHGIIFTASDKKIQGTKFAEQNAALFNGTSARITVPPDGGKFDFKETDFTVETWICTTKAGEIASSFPTVPGNEAHNFRLNVTDQGRIRVGISNGDGSNSLLALSSLTNCCDGSWHHVAFVRRAGVVEVYVDGTSVEVNKERKGTKALDISGKTSLTFGAFVSSSDATPQSYFGGMMREMRVWDIALDANKIQSRMQRVLNGREPQLLGYWPMDDVDISKLQTVTVKDVRSFVTELSLDTSSFPYLLDQALLQWPYSGHWSARGEKVVSSGPALDRSGVLAFGAGNRIYGVHAPDGMRAWSKDTPDGASAPVALGGRFVVTTPNQGVIAIDSTTGTAPVVVGFNGLIPKQLPAGTPLPAPATDGRYVAAAAPDGNVWIVENTKTEIEPGQHTWKWKAPTSISGDLSADNGRFYLIAGQTLYQLDPATRKVAATPVAGSRHVAAGDVLFCEQTRGRIVGLSTSEFKQRAAFDLPSDTTITGMCASADADLLVVATQNGVLYGLTFATLKTRWTTSIPAGTGGKNNALNLPVLQNRTVFCTSQTGTVAAVDANTGEFRGLFFEPTSITTAPVVEAGTIYFGCADAPADMRLLDGALHSVVFGRTNALRLNVDVKGAREDKKGYALVTTGDVLELLGVDQSCVEAWVNTREGGDILWIGPTEKSKFGLRLWLDKDGTIHYTCVDIPETANASWERITGKASSTACDGKWHHIAVSRSGRQELTIYLDGIALATNPTLETVAQPALLEGLKVLVGADGSGSTPANFFSGMIAEIRVWDTYMTATRISERMNLKLVGNEPDLLAYWNFDTLNVHDGSRYGHEGKLEKGDGSSGYWITDLNFTHPSYAYIETKGKLLSSDQANTTYELAVLARKGDGTPLDGQKIVLWYVRHKGETGPDKIKVSTSSLSKDLPAVGPVHDDNNSFEGTTDKGGKITFKVITSEPKH
ncbi:MAG TPA: LamG-like jellyroll fold domain-containing protein, partial [Pyrinomonadaceae bacterium]|nr:LamG-like jellyroll fold domain-containing protein [Pyrinomonadaceae bacterium]